MSKKWNSTTPSAFSSVFAVLILLSAGAAVAQQGGLQRLAAGAQDAVHGKDHSATAKEHQAAAPASAASTHSRGAGDAHANDVNGTSAVNCSETAAAVRADMPAVDDGTGIAHALSVLEANCAKNPQAHGLIIAIQDMGQGKGHADNGDGPGKPATSHSPSPPATGKPTASHSPPSPPSHPAHPAHPTH